MHAHAVKDHDHPSQCLSSVHTRAHTRTTKQAPPAALGMDHVQVRTYLEAIGVIAAHKLGVNVAALTPNVPGIRNLDEKSAFP